MFLVMNDYDRLHANFGLERNFLYCFKRLKDMICSGGRICDIFFSTVDLLRYTNRMKRERSRNNFFLARLTNPATLAVVQTVVSRVYYDLKAGRTAALLGPEAARFGYTCVVCGRQYKQLARHVAAAHRLGRVSSADLATAAALWPADIQAAVAEVAAVSASSRQLLRRCRHCEATFVCKCRLDGHMVETHYRDQFQVLLPDYHQKGSDYLK